MTINEIMQVLDQDLLKFAIHISKDFHKASDLKQDALVKAIENQDLFVDMNIQQIKAWFFRTIKNKFIDNTRRRRLNYKHQMTSERVEDFQENKILEMMLFNLPNHEKQIIQLRYFSGYNSVEIAEILNMKASTVRNKLSSALGKLRLLYQEER